MRGFAKYFDAGPGWPAVLPATILVLANGLGAGTAAADEILDLASRYSQFVDREIIA